MPRMKNKVLRNENTIKHTSKVEKKQKNALDDRTMRSETNLTEKRLKHDDDDG